MSAALARSAAYSDPSMASAVSKFLASTFGDSLSVGTKQLRDGESSRPLFSRLNNGGPSLRASTNRLAKLTFAELNLRVSKRSRFSDFIQAD
jgi:hypothetical protein